MRTWTIGCLAVTLLLSLSCGCQPKEKPAPKAAEKSQNGEADAKPVEELASAPAPDSAQAATPAEDAAQAPAEAPINEEGTMNARVENLEGQAKRPIDKKFAPVELGLEESKIPEKHRLVLAKLVLASQYMDALFLRQVDENNPKWREELSADPAAADTLQYFDLMFGPWDRLDADKPFWGSKAKPKGAAFYPEDLSAEQLEAHLVANPADKEAFQSYFTVLRRQDEKLVAIPYSEHYAEWLVPAAELLKEAASSTDDPRLAKYLNARAEAFASNVYRQSDMDWMDLGDGDIEVVIGPYEVYEDGLMGYKAAFEAFVTLRDQERSADISKIVSWLPEMEAALPMPDEFKRTEVKLESPLSVVDLLFNAGDAKSGIQTLAFNLPNDEVVAETKGTKKVMMQNVSHAKFDKVLMPIAKAMIDPAQVEKVSFEAFFNHTLLHEISHGLGPKNIKPQEGREISSINLALKDLYSAVEETKADILGMYFQLWLIDRGFFAEEYRENVYASFLGGFFRSVRFGVQKSHGRANMIQFNYLMEHGALEKTEAGQYRYVAEKMPEAVKGLATAILEVELDGDYEKAKLFVEKYANMPPELETKLASLGDIPTDIRPSFLIEEQMKGWLAP
ncbi:MAG: peptidase [Myxococcota bacterium]|jgi:hypothetical protein|nr:peptidase [Myxococcota bacterium]